MAGADPGPRHQPGRSFGAPDLVAAARSVASETLLPAAERTDQAERVPQENLDALADAGLYGLAAPEPDGPGPAPPPVVRPIHEALAGACGATFFVWAQHHTPVRLLAGTANVSLRQRWLEPLRSGRSLGGVAFAYLRWDRPGVRATAAPGGYRVNGVAPWATSWGMADVFSIAAILPGDEILWFCQEGRASDALLPSPPQQLVVMQSTSTVRLAFEDLFVPEESVLLVEPRRPWRRRDQVTTAQPSSAALGVATTSCRLLGEQAETTGSPIVKEVAGSLETELRSSRDHAHRLADRPVPGGPGEDLDEHLARMVEARTWNLEMAQTASQALVTAVGGGAMGRSHPAQRLAREATFYVVQAQTAAIRAASLRLLASRAGPP